MDGAQISTWRPRSTDSAADPGGLAELARAETVKKFGRAAFLVGEFFAGPDGMEPRSPEGPVPQRRSPRIRSSPSSSPAATATPEAGRNVGGARALVETLQRHEVTDALLPAEYAVKPRDVDLGLKSVLAFAEAHRWLEAGLALRALDVTIHRAPKDAAVGELQRALRAQGDVSRAVATVRTRYTECLDALRVLSEPCEAEAGRSGGVESGGGGGGGRAETRQPGSSGPAARADANATASESAAGDASWKFGQAFRGVSSHYKHDSAGRLWLRTEGMMEDVSMLECVALWKETDLFKTWFPLCQASKTLAAQGRVEQLAWMELSAPGLPIGKRDAVLHGYGVDALSEGGFMLILGRSAQQGDFPEVPFPPLRGFGAARMHVQGLQVLIQPLSERRVRCAYVVHIDMMAPLPAPILHFATQRVVGMIFHKLQKEARSIRKGQATSAHAARIARDAHVYHAWMAPRMREALVALGVQLIQQETYHHSNGAGAHTEPVTELDMAASKARLH